MRPLPEREPDTDRRWVTRVPADPHLRFDRNDYSLDPNLVGRRVEIHVSQREVTATRGGPGLGGSPRSAGMQPGTARLNALRASDDQHEPTRKIDQPACEASGRPMGGASDSSA